MFTLRATNAVDERTMVGEQTVGRCEGRVNHCCCHLVAVSVKPFYLTGWKSNARMQVILLLLGVLVSWTVAVLVVIVR